jgi:hypothetical protein
MADSKAVFIRLDTVSWDLFVTATGGGGVQRDPTDSPFLWTIFFKIDAESIMNPDLAKCFFTTGDHNDLGIHDVNPGIVIPIPESLGTISMNVAPLPPFGMQVVSSSFGVIVVLMHDGGHITGHGIRSGHEALNVGAQQLIKDLVTQSVLNGRAPTKEEIDQAVANAGIETKVGDAVKNAQSFCENLWSLSGLDSAMGKAVVNFSLDEFQHSPETKEIEIVLPVGQFNTWTIKGSVTVTDACPANAGAKILERIFTGISLKEPEPVNSESNQSPDMQMIMTLMRNFRDNKQLLGKTHFNEWWNLVKSHSPEMAYSIGANKDLQKKMVPLIEVLESHLKHDDKPITKKLIEQVNEAIESLQMNATCRLRNELRFTTRMISQMEGYTLHEALQFLANRRRKSSDKKSQEYKKE